MYRYRRDPKDTHIMLDLFDLTGEHTPVSLAEFLEENKESLMSDEEISNMRDLRVGQKAHLAIGGGGIMEVKRVH